MQVIEHALQVIEVEAESMDDAVSKVQEMAEEGEIMFDGNNAVYWWECSPDTD